MASQKMHLTVGDVARRSGLAVSAIHFYERKGLIAADRTGAVLMSANDGTIDHDVFRVGLLGQDDAWSGGDQGQDGGACEKGDEFHGLSPGALARPRWGRV